jgi:hypothetical protein
MEYETLQYKSKTLILAVLFILVGLYLRSFDYNLVTTKFYNTSLYLFESYGGYTRFFSNFLL